MRAQPRRSEAGNHRWQSGTGRAALKAQWPTLAIQRCTNHKLWNLLAKAPAHLREELAEDYRRMIYAESREALEHARAGFARKWKLRCKTVSASFEEASDELFTFSAFPISQWKALRTTCLLYTSRCV